MAPKRISMALFDEELKNLINASAKIFPITQDMVDNDLNPDGYEYGKIERRIYKWLDDHWGYIIADDIDIKWTDVQEKPATFPPSTHGHDDLHTHSNKGLLDTLTQALVDAWDTAVSHISDAVRHITQEERTLWNTVETHVHDDRYYQKSEVDTKLSSKSNTGHDHDGRYYQKSEVDGKLSGKSNTGHTHTEADVPGIDKYTKAEVDSLLDVTFDSVHDHANYDLLNGITHGDVTNWDEAYVHVADSTRHVIEDERALWNTVTGKAPMVHAHDYSPSNHLHDDRYNTKEEVSNLLSGKSDTNHIHDSRYYTESEVDAKLALKADYTSLTGHTGNSTIHVTQTDKDTWNGKTKIVIDNSQPTDASLWYEIN